VATTRKDRTRRESEDALATLGLSALEAELYCELADAGPTTGYGLSKALGKPVANTYKALYALEQKGAILVEEGETRFCRAVPPRELLARLGREFQERRKRAADALGRGRAPAGDDNVYRLATGEQVVERALTMIRKSRKHLLVEAFPDVLARLEDALAKAAARGVGVLVEAYEPVAVAGCEVVLHPSRKDILAIWPGQMLLVTRDGLETLQALLDRDGEQVLRATWTANPFLACQAYLAGVNNFALSEVMNQLAEGDDLAGVRARLARLDPFRLRHVHGFEALRRTGAPPG
jgi:sugar-specific transcriptional regulator TrmB